MAGINAKDVAAMARSYGDDWVIEHISEALSERQLLPEEFSLRDLFLRTARDRGGAPVGLEMLSVLNPKSPYEQFREAYGAVDSTMFNRLTAELVRASVMQGQESAQRVLSEIVPTVASNHPYEGRMVGVQPIAGEPQELQELEPYPSYGFGQDYIVTPAKQKRGMIVPLTREALFLDWSGDVLRMAQRVGEKIQIDKERRLAKMIVDSEPRHRYNWRGVVYETYQSVADAGPWVNEHVNPLVDWTSIDASWSLVAGMVHMHDTTLPIDVNLNTIILGPALLGRAAMIQNIVEERPDSGAIIVRRGGPIPGVPRLVMSRFLAMELGSNDEHWIYCDPSRAWAYQEVWPLTVEREPSGSPADFEQDIVARFKCREMGSPMTVDPRYTQLNKVS